MTVIINGTDNSASTPAVTGTDGDTGMFYPAANTVALSTGSSERMRVDSSGNVGIGTTSPAATLTVAHESGVDGRGIRLVNSSNSQTWENRIGVEGIENTSYAIKDITAGAMGLLIDTSANFKFNSGYGSVATAYGCRAWVNFDGTTNVGGNCTIRASGNVSTVADNGTGLYTVNFTTAMPDANYSAVMTARPATDVGGLAYIPAASLLSTYSTTAVGVRTSNTNASAAQDQPIINVAIFR
jgi:hypothetical protein